MKSSFDIAQFPVLPFVTKIVSLKAKRYQKGNEKRRMTMTKETCINEKHPESTLEQANDPRTESEIKAGRSHKFTHRMCEDRGVFKSEFCKCWYGQMLQRTGVYSLKELLDQNVANRSKQQPQVVPKRQAA